jgi:hypothetical protein
VIWVNLHPEVAEVVEKRLAVGECGRPVDAFARVDIIGEFARHFAELADMPDGTPEEVQRKANRYRTLREDEMECRWLRRACDFWTAGFFADKRHEAHVAPTTADVWKALAGKYEQGRLVLTLDSAYEYTDADLDYWDAEGPGSTFKKYYPEYYDLALSYGFDPALKPTRLDISERR